MSKRAAPDMYSTPKRARGRKKAQTSMLVAKRALALARKQAREVETKRYDLLVSTGVPDTGLQRDLAPLVKGTDENDRIGARVTSKRVRFKFTARASGGATSETTFLRAILVVARSPGIFVPGDYFEHSGAGDPVVSQRGFDQLANYKTLWDKTYDFEGGSATALNGIQDSVSIKIPDYLSQMQWDGPGNHEKNSIWLYLVSNQVAATNPVIEYTTRVEYSDA